MAAGGGRLERTDAPGAADKTAAMDVSVIY
jgi:hypothetical protein